MFGKQFTKEIKIDGMMCEHCAKTVKEALLKAGAGKVKINLEAGTAVVKSKEDIDDKKFREAIEEAGYCVNEIKKF